MAERRPDFLIIGAMKCATSTLHEQLALRSGLFLSRPKEPNFFSDDENWERGLAWYGRLFSEALPSQRCGESSTHYTKLPTHPDTLRRMRQTLPEARLIYVMRDPIERIVSQYIHEWSQREVEGSLDLAVARHERFVAYSCYARQLEPFLAAYGSDAILPVSYEHMIAAPDETLAAVCRFIDDPTPEPVAWSHALGRQNASDERLRQDPLRDRILQYPLVRALKDRLPRSLRERVKSRWTMPRRPELSAETRDRIEAELDADLARIGEWLGLPLSCRTWRQVAGAAAFAWKSPHGRAR